VRFLRSSPQVRTPPSSSDLSGTTKRDGSNSSRVPSPLQSGHMPRGELKENIVGLSSGKLMSQCGQAFCSESSQSSPSPRSMRTRPSPWCRAVSIESVSRLM